MATPTKYLFLYRSPVTATAYQPSPEEMNQLFAKWNAWKDRFKAEIIDMGDGLKPDGKVVRKAATTDGPFIEAKEVMGGYSIVSTTSFARAAEIANECPMLLRPGASIEIREMAGF
jgi:hypothetical protein